MPFDQGRTSARPPRTAFDTYAELRDETGRRVADPIRLSPSDSDPTPLVLPAVLGRPPTVPRIFEAKDTHGGFGGFGGGGRNFGAIRDCLTKKGITLPAGGFGGAPGAGAPGAGAPGTATGGTPPALDAKTLKAMQECQAAAQSATTTIKK